jgi:hypothetical protein
MLSFKIMSIMMSVIMPSIAFSYCYVIVIAECRYAECLFAECNGPGIAPCRVCLHSEYNCML